MYPSYFVGLAITVTVFFAGTRSAETWEIAILVGLTVCSMVAGTILPVFSLPLPDGPYKTATVTADWQNADREALTVQLWYPGEESRSRTPYRKGAGSWKARSLELVSTNSWWNGPVRHDRGRFPVVLFSPAWNAQISQNTIQFEMLASYGFVVAAIEHPRREDIPLDFDVTDEGKVAMYSIEVRRRADDIGVALDRLRDHEIAESIDFSKAGVLGHSFGGAVAAESCRVDERLKAGINMDGMMFGEVAETGVEQPFFFMNDDTQMPSPEELESPDRKRRRRAQAIERDAQRIQSSLARHGGHYFTAQGWSHQDFSDRPFYSPLRRLTGAGTRGAKDTSSLLNRYLLAFFDEYLRGRRHQLLHGPSDDASVVYAFYPAPVREAVSA